jgi:murein L,D-transpeptidase YafK
MRWKVGLALLVVGGVLTFCFWDRSGNVVPMPDLVRETREMEPIVPRGQFDDQPIPEGIVADKILVEKSARRLTLFLGEERLKIYPMVLGWNPVGHKEKEGDGRTPEGFYTISGRNPQSKFHLSLRISYPSPEDVRRAAEAGVRPGGDIMIHGLPNGMGLLGRTMQGNDWTAGCVAVTNDEIEEIWRVVADGTPVEIRP